MTAKKNIATFIRPRGKNKQLCEMSQKKHLFDATKTHKYN